MEVPEVEGHVKPIKSLHSIALAHGSAKIFLISTDEIFYIDEKCLKKKKKEVITTLSSIPVIAWNTTIIKVDKNKWWLINKINLKHVLANWIKATQT